MPYVGNKSTTFNTFSATDVSVTDDLTVTDDATIGGALSAKGGAVFNEDSADVDFRVESNANANMLFVDGGNNNVTVQSTSAGAAQTPFIIHNASSDANTDVRMLLAPCTTAADRPVILSAKNNGSNVVDFGISTPNGGTPVQRVTVAGSDGTIDVETGDIFFSTAGKGICLGATSATAANTLHDYEEGTWTPRLGGSTAGVATPGSNNNGYYTKIGQFVHVTGFLVWSEITTSISGDVQLQGLPFTVSNVTGNFPSQPITRQFNGFTNGSSLYQAFQAAPGTSVAVVNGYSAGGSGQNWTTSITASASGNIYDINLSYITSD